MFGKLLQIATATTDGTASIVTLTGINTDDPYILFYHGLIPTSHDNLSFRLTKSGSVQSDSNYDNARIGMPAHASIQENENENDSKFQFATMDEADGTGACGYIYCYQFNSASDYSFVNFAGTMWASTPGMFGNYGAGVHTVDSASDGVSLHTTSGNNFKSGGKVTLYRIIT